MPRAGFQKGCLLPRKLPHTRSLGPHGSLGPGTTYWIRGHTAPKAPRPGSPVSWSREHPIRPLPVLPPTSPSSKILPILCPKIFPETRGIERNWKHQGPQGGWEPRPSPEKDQGQRSRTPGSVGPEEIPSSSLISRSSESAVQTHIPFPTSPPSTGREQRGGKGESWGHSKVLTQHPLWALSSLPPSCSAWQCPSPDPPFLLWGENLPTHLDSRAPVGLLRRQPELSLP